jgi:gluconokinase
MSFKLLVMGVSGSGKSTLADNLSRALGGVMIEGDDHHTSANRAKMREGVALNDEDRIPWLNRIGTLLAAQSGTAVLSCSALKRSYRELLRQRVPDLRLVFLNLDRTTAFARVAQRRGHEFPPCLVESQFDALESPAGEIDVLRVEATQTEIAQLTEVMRWLRSGLAE